MKGWLYVISNKAVKQMVRVGSTPKDPLTFAESLDKAGLPFPYEVGYEALVSDMEMAHQAVSMALSAKEAGKGWYSCSVAEAVREIVSAAGGSILIENRYDAQSLAEKMGDDVTSPNPARREAILSDPSCPLNVLRFAVEREDEDSVLLAMLNNPACLDLRDGLIDLVKRLPDRDTVLMAIANNSKMPPSVLEEVFNSDGEDMEAICLALIRNPNFPSGRLADFAEYYSEEEEFVRAVLDRPDCTAETLARFTYFNRRVESLSELVVMHQNWSSEAFRELLEQKLEEDPFWVAEHPRCPPSVLKKLWERRDHDVRKEVLRHEACPPNILFDASFISTASVRTVDDLAVEDLAEIAISNPSNPLVIASSDSASEKQLRDLVSIGGREIFLRLARNESSPTDLLEALALRGEREVQFAVIENISCPTHVLTKLSTDDNEDIRKAVATAQKCPHEALLMLAKDDSDNVRKVVAQREECPSEILRLLAYDGVPKVGYAAVRNPNCPEDILAEFAESEFFEWKLAVLKNPKCPRAIAEYLAMDVKHDVRVAAMRKITEPRKEPRPKPKREDSVDSVRERFRNYVRKTLGALIEESELLRLSSLSPDKKEIFVKEFPSQAKQLAMFEKYLLPKIRESSAEFGKQ